MLEKFITDRIRQELPFSPSEEKEVLLSMLGKFLVSRDNERVFLLRGYAGTGKTSVISALVKALHKLNQRTVLLAPTGRAAKVISAYSGFAAYTIHKQIYREKQIGAQQFALGYNNQPDTLFIVDEASMISNKPTDNNVFGTGELLTDLIHYVFSAQNCSLILVGDTAQLPPVGEENSPALDKDYLLGYGLQVTDFTLTQVARQSLESGILYNATQLREQIRTDEVNSRPVFNTADFDDLRHISGEQIVEQIERSYREVGVEETMIVVRTNRRMNLYNQGIRSRVLWKDELLTGGDRIMITQNNYFFTEQYDGIEFLANGDIFEVVRLRNHRVMYGLQFADAAIRSVDYDWEIDVVVCLDTLLTNSPAESYNIRRKLFDEIALDYPEIRSRKELVKTIYQSPYYNALHIKHAYAVTCHKAQGGQWSRVFIDQGSLTDDMLGTDYYRWLYTALTRAKEKAYLINFPN